MIILLVLIGILALLSFYTVVICTGLLVYHVSAGWQETLQVVSALCILWFCNYSWSAGGVLDLHSEEVHEETRYGIRLL